MSDRTDEFLRAVNIFRPADRPNQQFKRPEPSNFTVGAKRVSFVLADLDKLILSLNKLVKQKDLFRDPTAQINEITAVFKRDFKTVNTELDGLLAFADRGSYRQCGDHFRVIIGSLKGKMAESAKKFQEALQQRTTVLKEQSSRRGRFAPSAGGPAKMRMDSPLFAQPGTPPAGPMGALPSPGGNSAMPRPGDNMPRPGGIPRPGGVNSTPMASGPVGMRRRPGGAASPPQWQPNNQANDAYDPKSHGGGAAHTRPFYHPTGGQSVLVQRTNRVNDVQQAETQIAELTGMFGKMTSMIAAQGEVVERIDDDMEETLVNTDAGKDELLKYFKNMQGDRSLILKLFAVLIFFIVLFTYFM
jgi:syntaxin 5